MLENENTKFNIVNEKAMIVDMNGVDVELRTYKDNWINFKFGDKLSVYFNKEEFDALTRMFTTFKEEIEK